MERLFLRCKKSVERAKDVLDMYYTLRTALPEIFSNRDPAQEWFKKITSVRSVGNDDVYIATVMTTINGKIK